MKPKKPVVKIYILGDSYINPGDPTTRRLYGITTNHPSWSIGEPHRVVTSPIIATHEDGTVETENTIYELFPKKREEI